MTESIALIVTAIICMIVPLIVFGMVWKKHPMERKALCFAFLLGFVLYVTMQWGVKEHGLQFLFRHTELTAFMNQNYLCYILLVAFAGACLMIVPAAALIRFVYRRQMSFAKASMFALGYAMAEAVFLVGFRACYTLFLLATGEQKETGSSATELFLSGYERLLYMIIHVAVIVALCYWIQQNMLVRGILITIFCIGMVQFLPGFFMAFTTVAYIETIDRPVAWVLIYAILTVAAVSGMVVMNMLKYMVKDDRVDSKQAIAAYRRKQKECTKKNS